MKRSLTACLMPLWVGLVQVGWIGSKAQAQSMPPTVAQALRQAQLPAASLSVVVSKVQVPVRQARWQHLATTPRNPASLIKLVTTSAALDVLGLDYTWRTEVYTDGQLKDGVLRGNVYLRGEGDPNWTMEKLWQFMRRIKGLGIARIEGDLVLDRRAFDLPPHNPSAFDDEPNKPYNAGPDAWLVNHHAISLFFQPDISANVARVTVEPPMQGMVIDERLPLEGGACDDWRSRVQLDASHPQQWHFRGAYPVRCGERRWSLAAPVGPAFSQNVIQALWLMNAGQLLGRVRDGATPEQATLRLSDHAGPLWENVLRINKYSNNVMAQQVFLTLGRVGYPSPNLQSRQPATWGRAQSALEQWWRKTLPDYPVPQVVNGSGLARETQVEPLGLAALLQWAWHQGFYPELTSSLPMTGLEGTLKRSQSSASAHLKTGSLRNVAGRAGFVDGRNGQRWVVVAIINHDNANRARPVLDAIVDWVSTQP